MPDFFPFIPGSESSRAARQHQSDSSPLLGRFRAVPRQAHQVRSRRSSNLGLLSAGGRGSVHVGYGALVAAGLESDGDDDSDTGYGSEDEAEVWGLKKVGRRVARHTRDLWVAPKQAAVRRVVDCWWSRWGVLVLLPAALVSFVFLLAGVSFACTAAWE